MKVGHPLKNNIDRGYQRSIDGCDNSQGTATFLRKSQHRHLPNRTKKRNRATLPLLPIPLLSLCHEI
jgi:hypothetical protein